MFDFQGKPFSGDLKCSECVPARTQDREATGDFQDWIGGAKVATAKPWLKSRRFVPKMLLWERRVKNDGAPGDQEPLGNG